MEPRVGNKFRLGRKIGSGSFGEIYLGMLIVNFTFLLRFYQVLYCVLSFNLFDLLIVGTNIQTNEEVAIKLVSFFP